MVSESALPLDKGLDRPHDDNVRIRRHEVTMAAIIVKDRDRNRGSGLILVRTVSLVGNGGRRDAVCVYSNRLIVMVSVPALMSVVCVAGREFLIRYIAALI